MKNCDEVRAEHITTNPEQVSLQGNYKNLYDSAIATSNELGYSGMSAQQVITEQNVQVLALTAELAESKRLTETAQAEAIQAGLARDSSNRAARAQSAKLMAMTDHPDGFKLLGEVLASCAPSSVKRVKAEREAYKWGYTYLQDRMHSLDRHGWAIDCDSEIEARIEQARRAE